MRRIYKRRGGGGGGGGSGGAGGPLGPLTNRLALHLQSDFGVTAISGKVSEWAGQEGFRNTVVQATDANRPTLVNNVLDGKPAIRFAGTQVLESLAQVGVVAGDLPRVYLVGSFAAIGTSYAGVLATYDQGAVAQTGLDLEHFGTNQYAGTRRGGGFAYAVLATASGNNSVPVLFSLRNSAAAIELAINDIVLATTPAVATVLDLTPTRIRVGDQQGGGRALTGDIFCVIVVNNETASSHATIMNYLKATYPSLPLSWPQTPPLPASAVEYWHSELQCTPSAWAGQLQGLSLAGIGSPVVAADPGFFNGRVVAQAATTGSKNWANRALPVLAAAGTRPWYYVVARFRSLGNQNLVGIGTTAPAADEMTIRHNAGVRDVYMGPSTAAVPNGVPDTAPHRFQVWRDVASANFTVDGINASVASGAAGITNPIQALAIASAAQAQLALADASVAFWMICSSKPTAPEIAALDAWAQAYWGV